MGGLSRDPDARRRQLANLRAGAGAAGEGNRRAVRHGGRSEVLFRDVAPEVRELAAALGDGAPVRDADGGLPPSDAVAVERAARILRRLRSVESWLDLHGQVAEDGTVRPAAELAVRLSGELGRALDSLGMSPRSRAALGLDLVRAADMATAMSEPDAARRRALLAEAGLDVTDDDPEVDDG